MKTTNLIHETMARLLYLTILIAGLSLSMKAQMPSAITIDPPDATAFDELTLTFDPAAACFQSGSLEGLPSIAMHSGVTFFNGDTWQNVVVFNGVGANGQMPILLPTGDGRYSITFTPSDFYGFPPFSIVTQICAVFNNGYDWSQDGRDFIPDSPDCMDFFIPINYPASDPQFQFKVNMNKMIQEGNFDPFVDSVFGTTDQPGEIQLFDFDGDGIYQGSYSENLVPGQTYDCKFRINEDFYEDVTRTVVALSEPVDVTGWWNDEADPDASVTIADFEDGTSGPLTMHVMGCGEYDWDNIHPLSETFYIVDNPDSSEINPSAKVMKFIRRGLQWGAEPWGGFWAQCDPSVDITFVKYVHVKIWKPRTSQVRFKIEGGTDGTLEIPSINDQVQNNDWEEYVFDFSSMTGTYPTIAFMPDYEDPLTLNEDIEIYFDDIVINNDPNPIYVGIDVPKEQSFSVFPNPAKDKITIAAGEEVTIDRVSIYNQTGQMVYEGLIEKNSLDISKLTPGIYIIQVFTNQGNMVKKLIVQ